MELFYFKKIMGLFLLATLGFSPLEGIFKTGADRLCSAPSKYLKGKNIGVLCQRASIVSRGKHKEHLVDALARLAAGKGGFKVVALFAPEHGFEGKKEAFASVGHAMHPKLGCPIYSLHFGSVRKPQEEMLKGLDLILIDLQEVGVRCYTYISTMINMIEAAAKAKIPVVVLDRPNPIKSWGPSGEGVEEPYCSFLAKINIPFIHGMTIGEIAKKAGEPLQARVKVIETKGSSIEALKYLRHYFVPPSPNLASLRAIFCYPMTVALEATNYSEGRGTETPFELFGAPWVDGKALAARLNEQKLSGVIFEPTSFTPQSSERALKPKHRGKECGGVLLKITDREAVKPLDIAQTIISTLFEMYPLQSRWLATKRFNYVIDQMMAGPAWRLAIESRIKEKGRPLT